MREGVGRDCRDSQTMGYETYYYAMLLPGGDILRVAQDSETICRSTTRPCPPSS